MENIVNQDFEVKGIIWMGEITERKKLPQSH
jgi:hypothetical protein